MSTPMPKFDSDPTVVALIPAVNRIRSFAAGLVIKSSAAYEEAASLLKSIKGQLASFEDARTKITKPINDGLREINAQHKATVAPLLADEVVIKNAMIRYSNEQDAIREEAQRKANEIAEKERRRLQAIADEALRKANEEAARKRKEADDAAAAGRQAEADKLRASAARVEERAVDKSEQFQTRAASVVAPVAQQAAPKVGGISIPLIWEHEVFDKSLVPDEYKDVNETRIRKVVNALQGNTNIPGVRVRQVKRIAAGVA